MKIDEMLKIKDFLSELQLNSFDENKWKICLHKFVVDKDKWDWFNVMKKMGLITRTAGIKNDEEGWNLPGKYYTHSSVLLQSFGDASKTCNGYTLTDELAEFYLTKKTTNYEYIYERKPFDTYLFAICEEIDKLRNSEEPVPLIIREWTKVQKAEMIRKEKLFQAEKKKIEIEKEMKNMKEKKEKKEKEAKAAKEHSEKLKIEKDKLKLLKSYSDIELANELKLRGYQGNIEFSKKIKI
jgi:hypothetical protein